MAEKKPFVRGRLRSAADMLTFALAGNATLTLVSEKTGTRYTFKINKPKDASSACPWFVHVMYGPDNETQYAYLGCVYPDRKFKVGRKSKITPGDVRARAFDWFWANVSGQRTPPQLECWHEGRCCKCGRKLTVPESIANGIGPECRGKVNLPQMFCEAA